MALEGCICRLLLSSVYGPHIRVEEILDLYHWLHRYHICRDDVDTDAMVSPNIPQLVSFTLPRSEY